jgi:lipopolysaccharide export system protein LptC
MIKASVQERFLSILGVTLLSVLAGASYYSALKAEADFLHTDTNSESPNFVATNLVVTSFETDGTAKTRTFAEQAISYEDGRMFGTMPRYVTINPAAPQTRARADKGTSKDGGESVFFEGNVVVTREADAERAAMRMTTPNAWVYPDEDRMRTEAPVRMTQGNDLTTGIGMKLDIVERTVQILKDVHTVSQSVVKNKEVQE